MGSGEPAVTDVVADWIHQLPVAALVVDATGAVSAWNEQAEVVLGGPALGGAAADAFVDDRRFGGPPARWFLVLLERARTRGVSAVTITLRRGRRIALELHARALADGSLLVVLHDVTRMVQERRTRRRSERSVQGERAHAAESLRRSEEQLRQAQKMDAIGRLAAGIAHDFNNVLTAIQGHVQFLLDDLPASLPARDDAIEIRRAAERATALTRQLLTFARRQVIEPVDLDLNEVVNGIVKLLRRVVSADIRLETQLAQDVPEIVADVGQIEQVLVNLVVNARDAITEGGVITLRTALVHVGREYAAPALQLSPGRYVQLTVSDTGHGMTEDVQRQIFEPFFTTKTEGTGLGLPTVYGIVKQAGGHVSVYSEPNVGTTVKVLLPLRHAALAEEEPHTVPEEEVVGSVTAGTVLLVEDDEGVRGLARRTLAARGYTVLEARDGDEALGILHATAGVDVVVTDLNMPNLNGDELARRVEAMNPHTGLVMMSGFPESSVMRSGRLHWRRRFLEKPFTPASLVEAVSEAMEAGAGA